MSQLLEPRARMDYFLLFLLILWGIPFSGCDQDIYGTGGGSVLLPVHISNDLEVTSIFWHHEQQNTKIYTLAIVRDGALDVKAANFKGRLQVMTPGYSLIITDVKPEDSGKYTASVYTNAHTLKVTYTLHINGSLASGIIAKEGNSASKVPWIWMNIYLSFIIIIVITGGRT